MYARASASHDLKKLLAPPRKVYRRRGVPIPVRCVLFFLIPLVWAGVYLLWLLANTCGMAMFGQPGRVTVTSRQQVHYRRKDQCRIGYVYVDADGKHLDSDLFPASAYRRYPPGSTIPMRWFRMLGHTSIEFGPGRSIVGLALVTTLWNGFLLILFHLMCIFPLRRRRLLRDGNVAVGQIDEKYIQSRYVKENTTRAIYYMLYYLYPRQDGTIQHDEMQVRIDEYDSANEEDEVLVFYNPLKPTQSVLYRYCDYALRELEG